jgi:hypothetical protein
LPSLPPTYQRKNDNNNKIDYTNIMKEELSRQCVRQKWEYPKLIYHRVRFLGHSSSPLQLKSVSFKGVDLSQVEFHNVKWLKKKGSFINRTTIVDEETLDEYANYQDVYRIYNQLRKNYESKLLFNEASHFFVGEMEAIRKSLLKEDDIKSKLASIGYFVYKWLALYGESIFLPLIVWTISMNITFFIGNFCNK